MKLLIGCPVRDRDWILWQWFAHVFKACEVAQVEPEFIFVCDPNDDGDLEIITSLDPCPTIMFIEEPKESRRERISWDEPRYSHMVGLRNLMLRGVREKAPSLFLSLDSDILLHTEAIKNLLESVSRFDAVGGKTHMFPVGTWAPSYAHIIPSTGGIKRDDTNEIIRCTAIMAIKLMTPKAYNCDYKSDFMGEDIGWSRNVTAAGGKLGFDGRVTSKHVMYPYMLNEIDERCGF